MTASILITWRSGATPERRDNLLATLAWLAQTPAYEVIVVEQDAVPRLEGPVPHPRCRVLFAYNPGPFNKAWGYNIAAQASTQPVLAFCDGDVIAHDMLERSVAHCAGQYALVKPCRRVIDLDPVQSTQVRAGDHAFLPPQASAPSREAAGEYVVLCGGLFLMRAASLRQLGGWDERFRGWGGEDDALTYVAQRARLPTLEFDERPALHLWHPRAELAHMHYGDNCALVARYRRYTDAQLNRLAEVNRQVMGNSDKYRPQELAR